MNKKVISLSAIAAVATIAWSAIPARSEEPVLVPSSQADGTDLEKLQTRQLPAKPKIGLALGGGGARGAAEVGILEVFEREGIHFDYIAGTSIGSIVGGLYDAGVPLAKLRKEFESGRAMRQFLPLPLPIGILVEPYMLVARGCGYHPYDGLYPGVVFRKYLKKLLPENAQEIGNLKVPYAAVSQNLLDGKPYMIRGGSLVEAMRASSAVPGLRKPVELGGKLFVDGGVACNLPVKQCREMGADIVIAVNIDEPFSSEETQTFRKAGSVSKRMVSWTLFNVDKPQADIADVVIHPETAGIGLITGNRKLAKQALQAGREAAEAALPTIREKLKAASALAETSNSPR